MPVTSNKLRFEKKMFTKNVIHVANKSFAVLCFVANENDQKSPESII